MSNSSGEREPLSKSLVTRTEIAILLIALVVFGGVVAWQRYQNFVTQQQQTVASPSAQNPLRGQFLMAIVPIFKDGSTGWVKPYMYDFGVSAFYTVDADKLAGFANQTNLAYQHVFSSDSRYITFIGATDVPKGLHPIASISAQVYVADVSNAKSFSDFLQDVQNAPAITSSTGLDRQFPSVSNQGDTVYQAIQTTTDSSVVLSSAADSWSIHLIQHGGTDQTIATGVHPVWVSNTQFIFLKDDGLYLYDTKTAAGQRLWGSISKSSSRDSLAISGNGQSLAWSVPEAGSISVFHVSSWSLSGGLSLTGAISEKATGIVFSPDSSMIAALAPDATSTSPETWKTQIDLFDTATLIRDSRHVDLTGAAPDFTYLTGWTS